MKILRNNHINNHHVGGALSPHTPPKYAQDRHCTSLKNTMKSIFPLFVTSHLYSKVKTNTVSTALSVT